ncbi:hypothetical protein [Flavobacterium circumlabens]|nr:hypothetical protein [Flavobacterium circumlabens]
MGNWLNGKWFCIWEDLLRLFALLGWQIRKQGLIAPKPAVVPRGYASCWTNYNKEIKIEMTNGNTLLIAFGIVILNIIIDHLFAPIGLILTPIILIIVSFLIAFQTYKIKPIWKSILTFGLVALHDIGIKLYGGGSHDIEGQLWVHMLLFIGLFPTFGILLTSILRDGNESVLNLVISALIFPILIFTYLHFFSELGIGRHYW